MSQHIKFTQAHEAIMVEGADIALIGITDYAQNALGDLVYLDLPEVGRHVKAGDYFAVIESVKAASEIYTPVTGEITDVNMAMKDNVDLVKNPVDKGGWIVKIKMSDPSQIAALMDEDAYKDYVEKLK